MSGAPRVSKQPPIQVPPGSYAAWPKRPYVFSMALPSTGNRLYGMSSFCVPQLWWLIRLSVFPVDTTDMLNYLLWLCFSPFALKTLKDLNFCVFVGLSFVCCTLRQLTKKYFYELDFVFFQFWFPLMIFCSLYLSNCPSFVFLSYSSLVDHYSRTTTIKPTNGQLSICFQAEKYKA